MNMFFAELRGIRGKNFDPEAIIIHEVNLFPPNPADDDSVSPRTLIFFQRADGSLHTEWLEDLDIRSMMKIVKQSSIPIVGKIQ